MQVSITIITHTRVEPQLHTPGTRLRFLHAIYNIINDSSSFPSRSHCPGSAAPPTRTLLRPLTCHIHTCVMSHLCSCSAFCQVETLGMCHTQTCATYVSSPHLCFNFSYVAFSAMLHYHILQYYLYFTVTCVMIIAHVVLTPLFIAFLPVP